MNLPSAAVCPHGLACASVTSSAAVCTCQLCMQAVMSTGFVPACRHWQDREHQRSGPWSGCPVLCLQLQRPDGLQGHGSGKLMTFSLSRKPHHVSLHLARANQHCSSLGKAGRQSVCILQVPELCADVQAALSMLVIIVNVPCCRSTRVWPRPEPGAALMSSIASRWQCCLCAPHSIRWVNAPQCSHA